MTRKQNNFGAKNGNEENITEKRMDKCRGAPYRWSRPQVIYTNWTLFCTVSVQSQSQSSLSEPLPREVIFLIVKLRRGLSQLSFVNVLFSFNIFLITYFYVVLSFEPPLDHNNKQHEERVKRIRRRTEGENGRFTQSNTKKRSWWLTGFKKSLSSMTDKLPKWINAYKKQTHPNGWEPWSKKTLKK